MRQERGPGRRRWFESDGFEVVVWFHRDGHVTGFQFCYDLGEGEHALTWREGRGFAHSTIDTGDETPLANRTPVLVPDGEIPWNKIEHVFDERSKTLEPALRRFIHDRLVERAEANAS